MDLGLKDRVALIGGGSKGFGRACAMRLASEGASVVICARGQEQLNQTASDIRNAYGTYVLALPSDWSKHEDIKRVVAETVELFGKVDILVHNTGGPPAGGFWDQTEERWQNGFDLVLMSAVRMYREVVPHMRKQQWGRIVNIESTTIKEPWDTIILSSVMRAGVASLAKTVSRDLAKDNILINTVCPGPFRTDRFESLIAKQAAQSGRSVDEVTADWVREIPAGKVGEPDDLASLVAFLASDRANHLTGTVIQTDGGALKGMY